MDSFRFDDESLRTTKVAIQCKRYSADKPVGSQDLDGLGNAINKYSADYGILFTTSYFTSSAREGARLGTKPITLIDGNQLVDLMIKYNYKVHPVPYYDADDQYFDM